MRVARDEAAEGPVDARKEVARPSNVAGDGRHVARLGRRRLLLLVQHLHAVELQAKGGVDGDGLLVQLWHERLAAQHRLKLGEQRERRRDGLDRGKGAADEELQLDLEAVDGDVELDVVAVKDGGAKVEQRVAPRAQRADEAVKLAHERRHALELVRVERSVLLDRGEEVDELDRAAARAAGLLLRRL